MDVADPLIRDYLLLFEAHIAPPLMDDYPAVALDQLLILHGRVLDRQRSSER